MIFPNWTNKLKGALLSFCARELPSTKILAGLVAPFTERKRSLEIPCRHLSTYLRHKRCKYSCPCLASREPEGYLPEIERIWRNVNLTRRTGLRTLPKEVPMTTKKATDARANPTNPFSLPVSEPTPYWWARMIGDPYKKPSIYYLFQG